MATKPTNIRIDPRTDEKIDEAVRISGLPKADVIRQALALGLRGLESIGFDMDGAIYEKVARTKEGENQQRLHSLPKREADQKVAAK